jgi:hypothetical protein
MGSRARWKPYETRSTLVQAQAAAARARYLSDASPAQVRHRLDAARPERDRALQAGTHAKLRRRFGFFHA